MITYQQFLEFSRFFTQNLQLKLTGHAILHCGQRNHQKALLNYVKISSDRVFIFSQYFLTGCKVRDYPTMFISLFINFKPNLQFKQFSDIFCGYRKIEHWSKMD